MLSEIRRYFSRKSSEPADPKIERLAEIVGRPILNSPIFEKALRHRSIIDESDYSDIDSYERLEFLGDAVLDLITTEIIFERYPDQTEGFLTKLRAKLVKGEALAEYSRKLNLGEFLEIGDRARGQGIEQSKSILADVFEALIGAVYREMGYEEAYQFVERVYDSFVDFNEVITSLDNYKSLLLEYTQAEKMPTPRYYVVEEHGPGHDKTFEIVVKVGEQGLGKGMGKSKKEAEQNAAMEALESLEELPVR